MPTRCVAARGPSQADEVMALLTARRSLIAYNGYDVGLGNRLRVTLGAKGLAAAEGREFCYVWPTGARFGPRVIAAVGLPRAWTVSRVTSRFRSPATGPTWTSRSPGSTTRSAASGSGDPYRQRARPASRGAPGGRRTARTRPGAGDRRRGARTVRGAPRRAALRRVMIRAHQVSHARTREASPVEWFVRRMHEIREADPTCASSSPAMSPRWRSGCSPRCRVAGRSRTRAVQHDACVRASVIDLYLLASAGYLLGPHFSSFVEMAVYLSGRRLTLSRRRWAGPRWQSTCAAR